MTIQTRPGDRYYLYVQHSRREGVSIIDISIAEIHFPKMEALRACAASDGGKQTIANAVAISSGGAPILLVAEEETFGFQEE